MVIKLKCTGAIAPGDKQTPYFTKGKVYDAKAIHGVRDELEVEGDRVRKSGSKAWQAVKGFPDYWSVLGVAIFKEVKCDE